MSGGVPMDEYDLRLGDGRVVRLRPARSGDGALFHAFFAALSSQSRDFMHGWHALHTREHGEWLAARTRCSDHCALIAVSPGAPDRIAGYCWIDGVHTADPPMLGIGVIDEFHGVGLGKALLRTMIQRAGRLRLSRVRLGVWADNGRALHVYRSVGFREDPSAPPKDFDGRTELYLAATTEAQGDPPPREFPLVVMSGDPWEMGQQHGLALKSLIGRSMGIVQELLHVPLEAAVARAAQSIPYCRDRAPELMEETRGVADGSGRTVEEIFMLNASLDLIMLGDGLRPQPRPDCWSLAASGEATEGGRTLVTWTAEDSPKWFDACVLLAHKPSTGAPTLMWTFAGFIGRPGMNPRLALSAACRPAEDCGPGLPYPFVCRKALACRTTAEAVRAISEVERMSGLWYTLGDERGNLATLRTSARTVCQAPAEPGWTGCAGRWADARLPRARELLRERWGRNTPADAQRILRDHGPGTLCPHDGSGLVSLTTFICDVNACAISVSFGSPCANEYVRYTL